MEFRFRNPVHQLAAGCDDLFSVSARILVRGLSAQYGQTKHHRGKEGGKEPPTAAFAHGGQQQESGGNCANRLPGAEVLRHQVANSKDGDQDQPESQEQR